MPSYVTAPNNKLSGFMQSTEARHFICQAQGHIHREHFSSDLAEDAGLFS